MPMPRKQEPAKHCMHCGSLLGRKRFSSGRLEDMGVFQRRKYCDKTCMAAAFDAKPVKADPNWMTAHHHARKACPAGPCSHCGKPGRTDVHHKDENWRNNSPDNLIRLCRSCHIKAHQGGVFVG